MTASPKAILSRVILILFGLCLSLVVVEAILRVGALFVGREVVERSVLPGKWRMLCLGDSNTYGLYVDKSQAYPKVFETLWNATPGDTHRSVEVLNLGFPGTNSSKLVKDFRRMLSTFRPDVVPIMVGANDLWTMPETAIESPDAIDRLGAALWRMSRAYRFLYMVRRAFEVRQLDVTADPPTGFERGHGIARFGKDEFDLGWTKIPEGGVPDWEPTGPLEKNLQTLAIQAAEFGTKLIFLTYAADSLSYSWANKIIRRIAKTSSTRLIDVAAVLKPSCPVPVGSGVFTGPGADCPELFPDQHPTVKGHERVARVLAQQLMFALQQSP